MVRNFWYNCEVDGIKSSDSSGPKSKDGGMNILVSQRNDGAIEEVLDIRCSVTKDGQLKTLVYHKGVCLLNHTSRR